MVENERNHSKMSKKVPFSSCVREAYKQKRRKKIVFDHANACASMRLLVQIHNKRKVWILSETKRKKRVVRQDDKITEKSFQQTMTKDMKKNQPHNLS